MQCAEDRDMTGTVSHCNGKRRVDKMPKRGEKETDELDSGKEGKSWKLNTVSVFVNALLGTEIQQWKNRRGKQLEEWGERQTQLQ